MKAIIPAAGFGTRMRPLTFTRPKPVLNVAGKPIIVHAIETLLAAGITEIGIVVSEITRPAVQQAVEDVPGVSIEFLEQAEMLGLGHAVLMGREWVGQDDVCVYLGDNLFQRGVGSFVETFQRERPDAVIGLVEVENPRAFGVAELDGKRIVRLVEKPAIPPSNLAVAGVYCFSAHIFEELARLKPSARGEYEITDAIQALIDGGRTVLGETVLGWWKDTGQPRDLIEANHLLLEKLEGDIQGTVEDSRLSGPVVLAATAIIRNSKIVGPAMIGEGVIIEDAYIGPFTSIGAGSVIRHAEVEHSVIERDCVIEHVETRLQDCLIGLRAVVRGGRRVPKTLKLTLSDESIVELT
ncbi:glucose-1-phosphate thymidylyltransferase [Deinococcus ruber]|uniref:Glucose-1-phosphate thymidylyltransferase n=1 Tax=Deinococcus ruber TaxID=1848197 RepID=A0A918C7I0_9DEIO|nr:glucose-1-phosphate thymidylyltransferase [Deinococcus ruber]GGR08670.1 glucose-1-phosphate thymidylyltransferase [Deinococcus ruber]